jgi:hypothetical protein
MERPEEMNGYRKIAAVLAGLATITSLALMGKGDATVYTAVSGIVTAYLAINLAGKRAGTPA